MPISPPSSGLKLWLKADAGVTVSGLKLWGLGVAGELPMKTLPGRDCHSLSFGKVLEKTKVEVVDSRTPFLGALVPRYTLDARPIVPLQSDVLLAARLRCVPQVETPIVEAVRISMVDVDVETQSHPGPYETVQVDVGSVRSLTKLRDCVDSSASPADVGGPVHGSDRLGVTPVDNGHVTTRKRYQHGVWVRWMGRQGAGGEFGTAWGHTSYIANDLLNQSWRSV